MARWLSAHSVRLKDFIGRPASFRGWTRRPGSATFKPGAIFCTPAVTTSSPAGRAGHEHLVVAVAVHRDGEQIDGSKRLGACAANDPYRGLALVLRDRRSRDCGCRRFADRALDDERGALRRAGAGGVSRASSRARNVRVCRRRLRRQFPQHDLERLLGRARQPRFVARRLEYRQAGPRARRRRSPARLRWRSRRSAALRPRPARLRSARR